MRKVLVNNLFPPDQRIVGRVIRAPDGSDRVASLSIIREKEMNLSGYFPYVNYFIWKEPGRFELGRSAG
jgi:hypothetical protein